MDILELNKTTGSAQKIKATQKQSSKMKMSKVGNQTNSQDPQAVNSRVFVGNLNTFQCSKTDVERMFQRYGRLAGISMHKGYAFVQFTNPFDARSACLGEDGRTVLSQILDYYWRDYFGTIPYDAIPVGKDHQGDNRYIGLVYNRGYELLPANVLPKEGIAQATAYTSVLNSTEYLKILCGPYKRAFVWFRVENPSTFHSSNYPNLIPGGSEVGKKVFITRVFYNGEAIVGKMHEGGNQLGTPFPVGDTIKYTYPYEVLGYDSSKQGIPCFNIRTGVSDKL